MDRNAWEREDRRCDHTRSKEKEKRRGGACINRKTENGKLAGAIDFALEGASWERFAANFEPPPARPSPNSIAGSDPVLVDGEVTNIVVGLEQTNQHQPVVGSVSFRVASVVEMI